MKAQNRVHDDRDNRNFFEDLYKTEYDNILNYVRRMVTDSNGVEDIVQETFFEACRREKELRAHPNVPGWLHLTAKNKVMKWEEKQRKYNLDFDFILDNTTEEGKGKVDDYRMVEAISTVRRVLSDEELKLFRCYYEYGYTSQEIAQRLGISETCFKVRILRMKQKIKNSLQLTLLSGVGGILLRLLCLMGDKL